MSRRTMSFALPESMRDLIEEGLASDPGRRRAKAADLEGGEIAAAVVLLRAQ
jgi:hypothetical protein